MMARISLRDEFDHISDEATLNSILDKLREDFLFLPLEDFVIEVHPEDLEPIRQQLSVITQQLLHHKA